MEEFHNKGSIIQLPHTVEDGYIIWSANEAHMIQVLDGMNKMLVYFSDILYL